MKGRELPVLGTLAALMSVLGACSVVGGRAGLEGTRWSLSSIDGLAPVPGSTTTAAFDASGMVGGSSGCNSYSAPYVAEGDSLTIGQTVGTLMACQEALMQQESTFLAALTATASYAIAGDTLILRDTSGAARLEFAAQSNELAGTCCIVTGDNNGQGAVVSVMAGSALTAAFGGSRASASPF